jgi:hypothetical protein
MQRKKIATFFVMAAGASTACRLVTFSATSAIRFLLVILRLSVSFSWKIITIVKNDRYCHMGSKHPSLGKCRWCCLKGTSFVSRVVFRIRKHFWLLYSVYGKMVFVDREVWTGRSQERTPEVLDLEPQILETVEENPYLYPALVAREVSQFVVCRTLKQQKLDTPLYCSAGASIATK